jgi:hypothetical protein
VEFFAAYYLGQDTTYIRQLVSQARKSYFNKMDHQKAIHWKEFLDKVSNIWKANLFTKGVSTPVQVPILCKDGRTAY